MSTRPQQPCSYPGCPNLVTSGRCQVHAASSLGGWKRDPSRQRLYDRRWQKFRAAFLAEHPWCVLCERIGIMTPAEHVDHVNPHKGDPQAFWKGPFQALCPSCHSRKTVEEQRSEGRGGVKKFSIGGCRAQVVLRAKKSPNVEKPERRADAC